MLLPIMSMLLALILSIFLIEYIFSEEEKVKFESKTKLDEPLEENIVLILANSNCIHCNNLFEYIDSLKDDINPDLKMVVVKYNKTNPNFGFPTIYKDDNIQVGFDKDKISNFFTK